MRFNEAGAFAPEILHDNLIERIADWELQ